MLRNFYKKSQVARPGIAEGDGVAQRQLVLPIALTHDFCYRVDTGCLT
jgi:hypothetical protein